MPGSSIAACPGMCDYRFYTLTECGPGNSCQCNMAYSGANCDIPQYAPTSVQATYHVSGFAHSITVRRKLDTLKVVQVHVHTQKILGSPSA